MVVSVLMASFWAFWGILENFHEGWYHHNLGRNLLMLFGQYLLPMLLFVVAGLLSVKWSWIGSGIHIAMGCFVIWFFWGVHPQAMATLCVPLVLLAVAYAIGEPRPLRWAYLVIIVIPMLVIGGCGIEPMIRVLGRIDDMDRGPRHIVGNGVDLVWCPAGPGWPQRFGGATWDEAREVCRHLSADGKSIMKTPQNIWRLPTVEEFVRSQHRHNFNCDGTWNAAANRPTYQRQPDKESPLWATDSNVIYWWVATEVDQDHAFKVSYRGTVRSAKKSSSFPYWGFRAVKEPAP